MRTQTVMWLTLVVSAAGAAAAQAQYPPSPSPAPQAGSTIAGGQPGEIIPQTATLSQWITYDYGDFGPVGDGIPVLSEVFLRSGFAIPTSAGPLGALGKALDLGWEIEGGGKLLFFNPTVDRAWTIWASISNVANRGTTNRQFTITDFLTVHREGTSVFQPREDGPRLVTVTGTVNSINRTYVNLGLGREWYLYGSANTPDNRWRVGIDGGGRWGSAIIRLNEVRGSLRARGVFRPDLQVDMGHRTDVIGAVFAAFYTDYAIPVGACTILTGVRGEWDYTWSDILQGANDIMSINALFTVGLLF